MDDYIGIIKKTLGGQERGFQFGMGAFFVLSEEWGEEIGAIEEKAQAIARKKDPTGNELITILKYNRLLIYGGMKNYDLINGNDVDYNFYKASMWMDEMDAKDFAELVTFATKTKLVGETKAEETETETSQP